MFKRGSVYFVLAPDVRRVKIGKANNVEKRLSSIIGQSPVPLILLGSIHGSICVERWCHHHCYADRSHCEWFHWTPKVAAFIDLVLRHGEFAAHALCAKEFRQDARKKYTGDFPVLPRGDSRYYATDSSFTPFGVCSCAVCVATEERAA